MVGEALGIIDTLLKEYRLGEKDFDGVIESLILILSSKEYPMEAVINTINNETEIIQNTLDYLTNK